MKRRLVKKWLKRPSNNRLGRKLWNEEAYKFNHIPVLYVKPLSDSKYLKELEVLTERIYQMTAVPKEVFE